MIANVSPSSKSYDDTQNTLKYANRAKEIKSSVSAEVMFYNHRLFQQLQFLDCKYTKLHEVTVCPPAFTCQLKSNVVSLDSHIGQYAVICEKQRQEVRPNQHYHFSYLICFIFGQSAWSVDNSWLISMGDLIPEDRTVEAEAKGIWGEEHGAWGF